MRIIFGIGYYPNCTFMKFHYSISLFAPYIRGLTVHHWMSYNISSPCNLHYTLRCETWGFSMWRLYCVWCRQHYNDVIKAPRHWPLSGELTGTGEFPAQSANNAENVSVWWRHHEWTVESDFCRPPRGIAIDSRKLCLKTSILRKYCHYRHAVRAIWSPFYSICGI